MKCPKCGSEESFARLYAAFWVFVDDSGDDTEKFSDHEADTELTDRTLCQSCKHEFDGEW